jgi:hypothetical protein
VGTYLVVANQTADSPELLQKVKEQAVVDPAAQFVLLVPATPIDDLIRPSLQDSQTSAEQVATQALYGFNDAGIRFWRSATGDSSPLIAIEHEIRNHSGLYDGIIVSTLPIEQSRWLRMDLPRQLEASFRIPVTHVVGWGGGLDNGYE